VAVAGAAIITVTRPRDLRPLAELGAAAAARAAPDRGVSPPIVKLGLEVWPSPLWACLIGYLCPRWSC
jgi:hypothetical protein